MSAGLIKYVAVHDLLEQRVLGMVPGDQLPTEAALCQEYNVSRITLRRAMGDLEREGLVVRQQGRGTFASRPALPQVFRENLSERITGFYRQQTDLGNRVATTVLRCEACFDIAAAERLGLAPSSALVRLERLRYVNGQLHQHVVTWLDATRFGDVADQDFTDKSLFEYLRTAHGIHLVRNELTISIVSARGEVAEQLEVPEGTPLLGMNSTVYDQNTLVASGITTHAPGFGEIAISLHNQV